MTRTDDDIAWWHDGKAAFAAGARRTDSRLDHDERARHWWQTGWDEAAHELWRQARTLAALGAARPRIDEAFDAALVVARIAEDKKLTPRERTLVRDARSVIDTARAAMGVAGPGVESPGPARPSPD